MLSYLIDDSIIISLRVIRQNMNPFSKSIKSLFGGLFSSI